MMLTCSHLKGEYICAMGSNEGIEGEALIEMLSRCAMPSNEVIAVEDLIERVSLCILQVMRILRGRT